MLLKIVHFKLNKQNEFSRVKGVAKNFSRGNFKKFCTKKFRQEHFFPQKPWEIEEFFVEWGICPPNPPWLRALVG